MSDQLYGRYHGNGKALFWLVMRTSFLTLITVGIYRFWAKTRIRKYLWSGTAAGDDSFEYTGTGLEKFLGFLVAIVVLAIYLGIVQMALLFFGLSILAEATTMAGAIAQFAALSISTLTVIPLILFAQYRARRYKLARTRWRGIRFGMDSAAWGYVLRAIGHYLLTLVTLGILLPRQTYYLEKFMTDRTWYGDAKFEQGGRWQDLYPGMKHIFIGVLVALCGMGAVVVSNAIGLGMFLGFVGYIWLLVGWVHYRVYAFNYLTENKTLNNRVGFFGRLTTGEVVGTFIKGVLLMGLISGVLGVIFSLVIASFAMPQNPADLAGTTGGLLGVLGVVWYVAFLLLMGALSFVLITQPIIAHAVGSVTLNGAEHLDAIQQRAADEGADAEGFADALDIGGAI